MTASSEQLRTATRDIVSYLDVEYGAGNWALNDAVEQDPHMIEFRKLWGIGENITQVIRPKRVNGVAPFKLMGQEQIDNYIYEHYQHGEKAHDIAEELGYKTTKRVYDTMQGMGHSQKGKNESFDRSVSELHWQGLSRPEIAKKLGCDYQKVVTCYKRLGLKANKVKKAPSANKVRKLVKQGLTIGQMAVECDSSSPTIGKVMDKNYMRAHFNQIQQLKRQYVYLTKDGSYRQYNDRESLQRAEGCTTYSKFKKLVSNGTVLTKFEWLKRQEAK